MGNIARSRSGQPGGSEQDHGAANVMLREKVVAKKDPTREAWGRGRRSKFLMRRGSVGIGRAGRCSMVDGSTASFAARDSGGRGKSRPETSRRGRRTRAGSRRAGRGSSCRRHRDGRALPERGAGRPAASSRAAHGQDAPRSVAPPLAQDQGALGGVESHGTPLGIETENGAGKEPTLRRRPVPKGTSSEHRAPGRWRAQSAHEKPPRLDRGGLVSGGITLHNFRIRASGMRSFLSRCIGAFRVFQSLPSSRWKLQHGLIGP